LATLHLRRALVWNPALRSLDFSLIVIIDIVGREREEETYTPKSYKSKIERLLSAKLTHLDQAVRLLDL
jgi:hypothetical protein